MPADVQLSIALAGLEQAQTALRQLGAEVDGVGKAAEPANRSFQQMGADLATLGAKITLVTAPLALFGRGLLTSAGDYEAAMNRLGVITDATVDQMDRVGEAARTIGAETTFAASDAIEAFTNLAKNGIDLEDSLGGVAQAAVDLAAATKTDLGAAADIAAKAMQQFGASASDLPRMMDQLYNATRTSTFELGDMALAMGQAGGVAAKAGVDFGEFNTAIAVISPSFFSGADAGTSFKVMLTNLVPQTKAAAEMAKELGLNFQDANGNFLPMRDIVGQLQTAFAGLSESQRIEAAQTLFGTDSMRAALALASSGVGVWDRYAAEIDKTGTTHAAATVAMQGFNGAIDQVRGAVENLGNALAASGFLDWVTKAVLGIADFINWVADLPGPVLNAVAAVSTLAVATGPLLIALGGVVTVMPVLAAGFAALVSPIGLAVAAVVGIGAAIYVFSDNVRVSFTSVGQYLQALWSTWDGTFTDMMALFGTTLVEVAGWATDFATSVASAAIEAGAWLLQEVSNWDIVGGLTTVLVAVAEWAGDFAISVGEAAVQAGQWLLDEVSSWDLASGLDALLTYVAGWASDFAASVGEAAVQAGDWLIEEVSGWDLGGGLDALLTVVADWAGDFVVSIGEAATQAGDWLVDEVASWDIAGGLEELLTVVAGWASDFAASVGSAAAEAGAWLVDAIEDWAPAAAGAVGYAAGYMVSALVEGGAELIAAAIDIGENLFSVFSDKIADGDWAGIFYDVVSSISEALWTLVDIGISTVEEFASNFLDGMSDALGIDVVNAVESGISDIYTVITTGLGDAYDGAVSIVQSMADSVVEWIGSIPSRLLGVLGTIKDAIVKPFQDSAEEVVLHSIVPDMVDKVVDEFGRMVAGIDATTRGLSANVTGTFAEMSAGIARETANIAHSIADTDWGLDAKMAAFAELEAAVVKTGEKGTEAMAQLRQIMADTVADAAADRLKEAMDAVGASTEQQLDKVLALRTEFQAYGENATQALAEITEKAQELYEELASQQIDEIFNDTTLTMRDQLVELENLRQHFLAMGADGAAAAAAISEEIDKLGTHVAALDDVLGGVKTALAENVDAWGGWGESAHDIVSGFSDGAKNALADFFETGKLNLADLGATFRRVLAEEAAEAVVAFSSQAIRDFLGFGAAARTDIQATGTAMTTAMTGATAQSGASLQALGGIATAAFAAVGNAATTAAQVIGNVVTAAVQTASNLFQQMGAIGAQVWQALVTGAQTFAGGAATAVTAFLNQAQGLFQQLGAAGAAVWQALVNGAQTFAGGAAGAVTGFLNQAQALFQQLGNAGAAVWQGLVNGAQTFAGGAANAVGGFLNQAQGFFQQLGTTGANTWQGLVNAAQTFAGAAANAIAGFVNQAQAGFQALLNAGQNIWNALSGIVANFAQGAVNAITGLVNGAINLFQNLGNQGGGIMTTLGNVISNMTQGATNSFSSWITSAINGFGQLLNSGSNTSSSLISTLGGAATSILSNFTNAFSTVGTAMGNMASSGSSALTVIAAGAKTAAGAIGSFIGDLLKFHEGGEAPHLQPGEYLAVLEGGEYVLNKDSTAKYRDLVEAINTGTVDDYFDALPNKNTFGEYFDAIGDPISSNVGFSLLPSNPMDIGPTDILAAQLGRYTVQTAAHFMGEYADKVAGLDKVDAYEGMAKTVSKLFGDKAKPAAGTLKAQATKINAYSSLGKLAAEVVGTALGGPVVGKLIGPVGATIGSYFAGITDEIFGGWLEDLAVKAPGTLIADAIGKGLLGMPKFDLGVTAPKTGITVDARRVLGGLLGGIINGMYTPLMVRDIFEGQGMKVEDDVYGALALNSTSYTNFLDNWEDMVGVGAVPGFNPRADAATWIDTNADNVFGEGNYSTSWYDRVGGYFGDAFGGLIDLFDGLRDWIDRTFGDGTDDGTGDGDGTGGGDGGGPTGEGGGPRGYAKGGWVRDGGRRGLRDTVLAFLNPDEFVVEPAAAREWGPLLEAINDGNLDSLIAGASERAQGLPFRQFATGGDALLTRPTLLLGGESGAEVASFRKPGGKTDSGASLVINGPVFADELSMHKLSRELIRRTDRQRKRLQG